MAAQSTPLVPRGLVPGVVILLVGAVFLADSVGMLDAQTGWAMWPIVVVVAGIVVRLQPGTANRVTGTILVVAGAWLLFNALGIWTYSFWKTWPALLILLGGWMGYRTWSLRQRAGGAPGYDGPTIAAEHVGAFVFLSSVTRRTAGQLLRDGELSAIAGDCWFDISNVQPAAEPIVIDVFVLGGRVRVAVPSDWAVALRVVPLAGRSADTHAAPGPASASGGDAPARVIVQGTAILGAIEIVATNAAPTAGVAA